MRPPPAPLRDPDAKYDSVVPTENSSYCASCSRFARPTIKAATLCSASPSCRFKCRATSPSIRARSPDSSSPRAAM